MTSSLAPIVFGMFLLQGVAAVPWLFVVLGQAPRTFFSFALRTIGFFAVVGAVMVFVLSSNTDSLFLNRAGRVCMSLLHLQIGVDIFVVVFWALLAMGSKAGAVALAAFQEGVRQPIFWLLTGMISLVMLVSVYIPYFTFGEDIKMLKDLCYTFTMFSPLVFGVFVACTSIHDEIEGRTAITVMSKPIHRRQFLLGKFLGLSMACLMMTVLLGWVLVWMILYKAAYDPPITNEPIPDPIWVSRLVDQWFGGNTPGYFFRGMLLWVEDAGEALPHLIIGYCHVLVMVSLAVAFATKLPMVVNIVACLVIYMLGHLTPIMTEVTRNRYVLVHFVAQLFENIFPGLDLFDVGSAIIRDLPLDPTGYSIYTFNVAVYALIYSGIAMLIGLILFEDRDLA